MSFEYSPYILPLIGAAFISVVVAVYAWMRRSANGALWLFVLSLFVFEWTVSYSLEIAGAGLETKYFWGVIEYFGIAFVPYGWLIFSITYSGQERTISRRFLALTALIPSITVLLALTTKWHGLVWSEYHIARQGNFAALNVVHGTWFFVHLAYSYIILLIGAFLLVRVLFRRKGMYRGQIIAMLVAVLAPWVGNALFLTGNSPIPYLDLTPFAFTVSVVAVAWAVFGFHLVDIAPLARDRVVDSMREGMIVLDVRGNVVDINNAAARMIGVPIANAIGKTAVDIFRPWSHLVERFRNVLEAKDEISVGEGAAKRRYEVRLSPLQDSQEQLVGRVILLRVLEDDALQPRTAYNAASYTPTQPLPRTTDEEQGTEKKATSIWDALIGYFFAQIKKDIPVPVGVSPVWQRTRERIFTVGARIVSSLGIISLIIAPRGLLLTSVSLMFAVLLAFLFWLGVARTVKYEFRITGFLALVFGFAFIETLNFGFSVESFTFFLGFVIIASVLTSRRGAISVLVAAIVSLSVFAVLIDSGVFIPLMKRLDGVYVPEAGFSSLLVFIATASAATAFIVILLENLNAAWQKEEQSSNLLRQERDLLEQRIEERTHDLADARDSAIRSSTELRKYYRAIEQSGSAIVITDVMGNIEYANPIFEESSGYALEEVIGKNPRILKSGRQKSEFYEKMWATISAGQVWHGIFHNKKKDGSLYWESATIAPVLDENNAVLNYVAIKEDVTARRKTEEQLQKLSRAVEQSGNTVIMMDKNGLIEYVNPKFTEVTGYSSEESLGKSPIELMNGLSGAPDFSHDDWWLTVNAGHIWHGEFKNHTKNGSEFWESATIAPVLNRDGDVINFVEIKQDITEQKIMQDQLQNQNDYLSILHQITLDLLNRRELNDLLQVIVDRSAVLLDAPFSELMLEEDGILAVKSCTENQPNLKGDRVARNAESLSWQAFDSHQPVILENYSEFPYRREIYDIHPLHAVADFPVMAGDRCLGILALGRSQPDYKFTAEQVETGILFARLVALVLDNANLYNSAVNEIAVRERVQVSLQHSHQQQQVINSLLKISLEDKSMDEVLGAILDEILSINWLTISQKGGIFLFNEQTNRLDLRVHRNLAPDLQVKCSQIALGQCLCGLAALTREIQFADCLDDRHEIRYEGIQEHGHYNIPILQGERILGAIVLYLPHGYQKTEDDLIFLRASADAITVILRRKQAEMLLLESEARFRQIVENASDIIYRADVDGNFIYVNPAALKMMGYASGQEMLGKNYFDMATPEFRHQVKQAYDSQCEKKIKSTYYEFPTVTMDGHIAWVGQNLQLIMDGEQISGFQAVARNITQLKQAQEAIALSRDQALDASRFKSQLLSRVSHELRTPLGGILGYAELLEYEAFGSLAEKQHGAVNHIIESTNYLTSIVNDLLDEAQIESKSLSLHNEYFNPIELLEKTKTSMSTLADKKGLTFRVEIDPELPSELYGDVNRLQQVLINLAGNAIKFTEAGEISISLKRPAPAYWSIEVRDTGAGISHSEHETIFEPFRQVSNSITRENRGSGLGLAITKQLVELMGGQISLESEIGRGSLFTVTLPITNAPGE